MNGKLLEDGTTMSDENLAKQVTKVSKLSDKASLSWVSVEVVLQSLVASAISGSVYTGYRMLETGPPTIGTVIHTVTGLVLGVLLVTRITIGLSAVSEAAATVQAFHKACRTLAVLTSYVGETLTISAGAELEKKAVANFRYELVRLLNLAVFSYQLMLHGQKMTLPPATLRAAGGKMEVEILASCSNPTVMVVKWITNLIEQQRVAHRISNEQVASMMHKIDDLIDAYHATLSQTLAPSTATLNSFSKFFVYAWVYTAAPVLALKELSDNSGSLGSSGFFLALAYTFFCALFYFGLYEAGTIMEKPTDAVTKLLPLDDLQASLSADLTDLVDDPEDGVPVFLLPSSPSPQP